MRLNQFLAQNLGISRRAGDKYITQGLVEVNGEIGQLFDQISQSDSVRYYNNREWVDINSNGEDRTILFYKPIFSLVSKKPEFGKKTVYDLLPKAYQNLKYAGRLDYMSEGLLVLTTSGELIQTLTHPSNESDKEYLVGLKYALKKEEVGEMKSGMTLEGVKLNPVMVNLYKAADVESRHDEYNFLSLQRNFWWYKFTLSEGKNNQIRNMCEAFGQKVLRLIRVKQGEYYLDSKLYKQKIIEVR